MILQVHLPLIFAALMGLSILLYVILDGYDLGVGILLPGASNQEKDKMIASIGPFWDANETWLVMGVGLLLVAFPLAHGEILSRLYVPTTLMLMALILRGVAFDFRSKSKSPHKRWWNIAFFFGSLLTSWMQGYMLGRYVMGFDDAIKAHAFAALTGLCLAMGYAFIGACWLIMKTDHALQKKAVRWARLTLVFATIGIAVVSLTTPLTSPRIFEKWFSMPAFLYLLPMPISTCMILLWVRYWLKRIPLPKDRLCWLPFAGAVLIFILCFTGLAYSFYPYIIPGQMTINEAAASLASLQLIFKGAIIIIPCILGYTAFSYRVFWGKAQTLDYGGSPSLHSNAKTQTCNRSR